MKDVVVVVAGDHLMVYVDGYLAHSESYVDARDLARVVGGDPFTLRISDQQENQDFEDLVIDGGAPAELPEGF